MDTARIEIPESEVAAEPEGVLGIAEDLNTDPEALHAHRSWMGISTNFRTYPNEMVLEYARWGATNTGGFTLIVSDWLNRYNWAAERGDWQAFDYGKHVERLERDAAKQGHELRQLFDDEGMETVGVVLWSRVIRKLVEESCVNDVAGMMMVNEEWARLNDTAERPDFQSDLHAIHQTLVPHMVERATERGGSEEFANHVLSGYSLEEIFLTTLLAKTGWAGVKIGPGWERTYDEITAAYLRGDYADPGEDVPFGAVYLGQGSGV